MAIGLQPPRLPEGDLLVPLRRIVLRAVAVFRAAAQAAPGDAPDEAVPAPAPWAANGRKIEAVFGDSAATAVALAVIGGALLFALM